MAFVYIRYVSNECMTIFFPYIVSVFRGCELIDYMHIVIVLYCKLIYFFAGVHNYRLIIMSDCYIGFDQTLDYKIRIGD